MWAQNYSVCTYGLRENTNEASRARQCLAKRDGVWLSTMKLPEISKIEASGDKQDYTCKDIKQ